MSFARLKEIVNIIEFKEIIDFLLFPIILIISLLAKPFIRRAWLIEENPDEACDNGYVFFKYLCEIKKSKRINSKKCIENKNNINSLEDVDIFYVINKKSKDYEKVKVIGKVINHGSLKHWIYYLNAEKIIVTQKYANPSKALFYLLHKYKIIKNDRIFLQHGVIKDDCKAFYYKETNFNIFICGAKREYEYVKEKYGYPENNVCYTGLARFDDLELEENTNNKLILIAPTWRKWIKSQNDFKIFMENYYSILENAELQTALLENNIKIQLVLHKNFSKFKIEKQLIGRNIRINHNKDVDIQELLNKVELLITDYSSIFMDVAYRKRPIIYYQFDNEEFRKLHLPEGYFKYKKDGFGDVISSEKDVIQKIKKYINNNFKIEKEYEDKMDNFFERKDKNNCQRILEEIIE